MKRNEWFSSDFVSRFFPRGWGQKGLTGLPTVGRSLRLGISRHRVFTEDLDTQLKIIDPSSKLFQQWYKVFVISRLVAIFVDPLFYYLPVVDGGGTCIKISRELAISLTVLRTVTDTLYLIHMPLQFRTAFMASSSRVFGRRKLVTDPHQIAMRYFKKDFWLDFVALLPLPQLVIWIIMPKMAGSAAVATKQMLGLTVLFQYLPRLFQVFTMTSKMLKNPQVLIETPWAVDMSNLLLYLLASHRYLQSVTVRLEEMRVKRCDTEDWMNYCQLPRDLVERVRRFDQYKWVATLGVDEEKLMQNLPMYLRRDIKRYLCLDLVLRVPFFNALDDSSLDAMCERLKPALYAEGTCIVIQGDVVHEMLFITHGELEVTINSGSHNLIHSLQPGDFCGEELLNWVINPMPRKNLPTSTRTIRALREVNAFALSAEDLKFVASEFRCVDKKKKLEHTARYYSHQWRTSAACFIQAAWRHHCRRKIAELPHKEEDLRLQEAVAGADALVTKPGLDYGTVEALCQLPQWQEWLPK
ncbi:unnamed protein product [Sphagnum jensenii]